MSASSAGECTTSSRRSRVTTRVAGISRPSMPSSSRIQLVAIEACRSSLGAIEQRPRPVRQRGIDLSQARCGSLRSRKRSRSRCRGRAAATGSSASGITYSTISSMPDSSSRNSIGMLLPMSVAAASASTRSRGCFAAQGVRNSRCDSSTSCWIARPACLSPSSCAISDSVEALARIRRTVQQLCDQLRPFGTKIVAVEGQSWQVSPCRYGQRIRRAPHRTSPTP